MEKQIIGITVKEAIKQLQSFDENLTIVFPLIVDRGTINITGFSLENSTYKGMEFDNGTRLKEVVCQYNNKQAEYRINILNNDS